MIDDARVKSRRQSDGRQSDDEDERTSNSRTARFAKRTTRRVTSRESAAPQISHAHDHVNDHSRAKARPTATPRVLGANQRAAHDSCANLTSAAQSHPSDSSGPLSSSSPGSRHTRHATPRARASSLDAARRPSRVDDVDGDDDGDARARSAYFRDIDPNPNVTSVRAFALASPAFVEPSFARVFARLARVSRVSRVSRVIRVAPRRRWTTRGDANDAGRREVARVVRARPSGVTAHAAITPSSRGGETSRDARAADPPTRDGGATSHGGARARRPAATRARRDRDSTNDARRADARRVRDRRRRRRRVRARARARDARDECGDVRRARRRASELDGTTPRTLDRGESRAR